MVDDDFVGKTVTVPSYVWPNEKVPRGKTGWEGLIQSRKGKNEYHVVFEGDANTYYFSARDIRKWLYPDEERSATHSEEFQDVDEEEEHVSPSKKRKKSGPRGGINPLPLRKSGGKGGKRPSKAERIQDLVAIVTKLDDEQVDFVISVAQEQRTD